MNMKQLMFLFLVCSVGQAWSMNPKVKEVSKDKKILRTSNPKLTRYPGILQYIKMALDKATEGKDEKIDI